MNKLSRSILFVVQFAVLGLAAAFVISVVSPPFAERVRAAFGPAAPPSPPVNMDVAAPPPTVTRSSPEHVVDHEQPASDNITVSYSAAVNRAAPAVVSITANKVISTRQMLVPSNPVLQRAFPGVVLPTQRRTQSLGSGVIVSSDGYVITNNHVIQGAEEIQVVLHDGRTPTGRVVGFDVDTDLAVLKIDAENLPSVELADKSPTNVGDVVLAIGNPFGLSSTVTMGIVSATGRRMQRSIYEDFIQTDAAINEGNSGGALVNAFGELVGINSNILSPNSGSVGIGFAIPVRTAKAVLDQIVANGHVIRGWLGAEYADIASIQNPSSTHGVAVIGTYDNGPAAQAGIRPGDVLLTLDEEPIVNQLELRNREATLTPGTKVSLSGTHNGAPFKIEATLQERPQRQSGG